MSSEQRAEHGLEKQGFRKMSMKLIKCILTNTGKYSPEVQLEWFVTGSLSLLLCWWKTFSCGAQETWFKLLALLFTSHVHLHLFVTHFSSFIDMLWVIMCTWWGDGEMVGDESLGHFGTVLDTLQRPGRCYSLSLAQFLTFRGVRESGGWSGDLAV